jgi:RNA polymerase sigma-70 factor (ECF subfamily)
MVANAGGPGTESREALEQLCQRYWFPLYVFLRKKRFGRTEAEDLTQGFFAHLLDRDRLQIADSQRGRFRTFLLSSIENFAAGEQRRERAEKRGGKVRTFSLDFESADARFLLEPADNQTAEHLFDRTWALTVLQQTMDQLSDEYQASGKGELFEALRSQLVDPQPHAAAAIAQALSMSEGAIRVAAHRLRQRYRDRLRDLVAQTVSQPDQVDEELSALWAALG